MEFHLQLYSSELKLDNNSKIDAIHEELGTDVK